MEELDINLVNILVKETAQTSEEIICKLGGLLYNNKYVKDTYVQAVLDREKVFPTGLQTTRTGFAIPHTDSKHVNRSAVAVATLNSPVMFKAMDDIEVDIPVTVVMMLAVSDPKMVIETLTKVISILENESALDKIIQATTKLEIQEALNDHIQKMTEQRAGSAINYEIGH